MSEKGSEVQELSSLYLDIIHKLNSIATPDWLQLDLTFQQMKVLYILKQKGTLTMSELHEELGVSMPTITGIVNRLIERRDGKPLLTRETSPEDRREVRAKLTEAGIEVTEMVGELSPKVLEGTFARLGDKELQAARQVLDMLRTAAEQQKKDSHSTQNSTNEANMRRNRRNNRKQAATQVERENSGFNVAPNGLSNGTVRRFDTYSTRPILT
jgi:DNA-binding MarR family transcriptional regulator